MRLAAFWQRGRVLWVNPEHVKTVYEDLDERQTVIWMMEAEDGITVDEPIDNVLEKLMGKREGDE